MGYYKTPGQSVMPLCATALNCNDHYSYLNNGWIPKKIALLIN
jgi:hypothetical protein